ncbi:gfo/Idh/MocA family oxidoreductase, partial [Salmonella enterica subsp. enterica serovar Kentucky]|nr:gfo/Idh/MocA family oxidoreductase [Salmonella enterica subsp. enterica serovar Kentucky]
AIENDKEPVVTAQQAFIVTQVLEAIYKSAETGQTIQL